MVYYKIPMSNYFNFIYKNFQTYLRQKRSKINANSFMAILPLLPQEMCSIYSPLSAGFKIMCCHILFAPSYAQL